jgi:hypothetical protein
MKSFLVVVILFCSTLSFADNDVYGYKQYGFETALNYLNLVDLSPAARLKKESPGELAKCESMYKNPIKNGVMDIHYALGYFDISEAKDIIWGRKNFGISPSADLGLYEGLQNVFMAQCPRNSDRLLCGFQLSKNEYGRSIFEKRIWLFAKIVTVRLTLTHASASGFYQDNKTVLKDKQAYLTAQSEKNFFDAIGISDVVIYNGHSRSGGGPDFNPPILNRELHTDYAGYYKVKRPGINHILEVLKKRPNNGSVLGLFSCTSRSHFYNLITKSNPNQRLILSSDLVDYNDSLRASIGYLEGLLQGYCGQPLADLAKQDDIVRSGFEGFKLK